MGLSPGEHGGHGFGMVDAIVELIDGVLEVDDERATAVCAMPVGQHLGGGAQGGGGDDDRVGAARGRTQIGWRSQTQ